MSYIDGLPHAASVSLTDLLVLDQSGTGIPGSAQTRSATISQLFGGASTPFLPLVGGTLTGDLFTSGRIGSSAGQLRFVNNGASGFSFQNAAGGNVFLINGSVSAIANQVTMVPQVAGNGPTIIATGSDTNIDLKLASKGTGVVVVNGSAFSVAAGSMVAVAGTAPPVKFNFTETLSGVGDTGASGQVNFSTASDTMSKTSAMGFYPLFNITKNFGGGTSQGHQQALRANLVQTGAITTTPGTNIQYVPFFVGGTYSANIGGVGVTANTTVGAAYSFAATTWLQPGATNYQLASNSEWDLQVDGTEQILTLGGTITVGDTIALTFTSASIAGSPVTVTWTAATGNTLVSAVNGLNALIMNTTALSAAGISALPDRTTSTNLDIFWPTTNTVTLSVVVGGAATETASLGAVVLGASTSQRSHFGLAARGSGRAGNIVRPWDDSAIVFSTLGASVGATWTTLLTVGGNGVFPIAPGGTLLALQHQTASATNSHSEAFASPQLGYGFDLRDGNYTQYNGYPFASPGFGVTGTGSINLQNATISVTSTGLVLDVPGGRIGTGNPAIVSGGGGGSGVTTNNYYVGDIVSGVNGTDVNGGQYRVSAVDGSTGAVTGLTTLVQPSTTTASLGVGIATTGGSGTGLTITPTAATNNGIALAPSGGPTTVGGTLAVTGAVKFAGSNVVANGAIATTMTSLGPTGSHTTIQEWLTVQNSAGTTRYIPLY